MSKDERNISPGRTWIDTNLTQEETERLVADLMELSAHPTGVQIQALVREMKGNAPSERSCLEWRNNTYVPFYLRSRRLLAERITAGKAANGNVGAASTALLQQATLDLLLESGDNPCVLKLASLMHARLTEAEQNAQRIAQNERDLLSKIDARDQLILKYKAAEEKRQKDEAERVEKARNAMNRLQKKGGLTKAAREELDEYLGLKEAAA